MRSFVLAIVMSALSTAAFANEKSNLFKCVDDTSLAINHDCVSQKMEVNDSFVTFQNDFAEKLSEDLGGNAMATVIFYPELMQTRVIAHVETLSTNDVALNTIPRK